MTDIKVVPYGSWRSPITSDLIVLESISIQDVLLDGDDIYWLEGRPQEAGRYVLVRRKPDGTKLDVNPAPFYARTKVHEYGGGSVVVSGGTAYYSHFADQRLYRQEPTGTPSPLSPDAAFRYADGRIDTVRKRWIGVREDHTDPVRRGVNAVNTIVAVDLATGGPGKILVSGNDFYSTPRLNLACTHLAWLTWNHPGMPWTGTELWTAHIADDGSLVEPTLIAGGTDESIFQPEWSPDGVLHFISDRTNWWNLYRLEGKTIVPLCPMSSEFGQPQWNFGLSTFAFDGPDRIVCAYSDGGLGKLGTLDLKRGNLVPFDLPYTEFSAIRVHNGKAAFRAGSPLRPPSVVRLDLSSGKFEVLRTASSVFERAEINRYFTQPRSVEFPTEGNRTAFGLFYPPNNPDYRAPAGEKPPIVVKCHGGPTAAAGSTLDLRIQFWTSRGFAVLDVNYGGSTGFGREYRNRLNLQWGVVDVDDCINGAKHLATEGLVDGERAVITGGSAGGYTTLACLAFRDFFKGGASHYGVSDTEALVRDTHKFESRYLDSLIGPYPAERERYRRLSPVHSADRVRTPVIFFQGDEDEIVPPNQTEQMVDALRRNGIPVGYLLFSGEQHGFRKSENIKRALDAELYFYASLVFRVGLVF